MMTITDHAAKWADLPTIQLPIASLPDDHPEVGVADLAVTIIDGVGTVTLTRDAARARLRYDLAVALHHAGPVTAVYTAYDDINVARSCFDAAVSQCRQVAS